jgi:hypothetical protein
MSDLVMAVVIFSPLLVLAICVPLAVTRQPGWVRATAATLAALTALAWLAYWVLWGHAFEYADSDVYTPVPTALDRASNVAMASCFVLSLLVVAFGASRLLAAWSAGRESRGIGRATPA